MAFFAFRRYIFFSDFFVLSICDPFPSLLPLAISMHAVFFHRAAPFRHLLSGNDDAIKNVTHNQIIKMLPVALCYAGAHSASVFSFSAGSVSFGQIVKAAEPAFAAVLSQFVYKKKISKAKWLCLPIVIGGVILASVNELDFAWSALLSACLANVFAAVRGNENKKLMETEGLKDRLGGVGNQFCITSILGFLLTIPFVFFTSEGARFGEFVKLCKTSSALKANMLAR
jgi:solute carrier family 35 protein E1